MHGYNSAFQLSNALIVKMFNLGWPLPTNLEEVVRPNINKIEEDLHVDLWNSIAVLNKVTKETHICRGCKAYPFRTCM